MMSSRQKSSEKYMHCLAACVAVIQTPAHHHYFQYYSTQQQKKVVAAGRTLAVLSKLCNYYYRKHRAQFSCKHLFLLLDAHCYSISTLFSAAALFLFLLLVRLVLLYC
jgi:hypothetical protein